MEVKIPVRSFAIAADAAADLIGTQSSFIYNGCRRAASRARTVAVAAMIEVFPKARRATIAQGFDIKGDPWALCSMIGAARTKTWWRDDFVASVADAIKRDLAKDPWAQRVECDDDGNIEFALDGKADLVLKEPEREIVAAKYTPRRWRPARIIHVGASRPGNVTSALLGDPPAGRREMIASMQSGKYPGSYARQGE
jgi:hypothetical protein